MRGSCTAELKFFMIHEMFPKTSSCQQRCRMASRLTNMIQPGPSRYESPGDRHSLEYQSQYTSSIFQAFYHKQCNAAGLAKAVILAFANTYPLGLELCDDLDRLDLRRQSAENHDQERRVNVGPLQTNGQSSPHTPCHPKRLQNETSRALPKSRSRAVVNWIMSRSWLMGSCFGLGCGRGPRDGPLDDGDVHVRGPGGRTTFREGLRCTRAWNGTVDLGCGL